MNRNYIFTFPEHNVKSISKTLLSWGFYSITSREMRGKSTAEYNI